MSMTIALAGGIGAGTATAAEMMENNPKNIETVMDSNQDGRIDRDEFIRYQGRMFDRMAGTRGYAMPAEVSKMMKDFGSVFPSQASND
jgi:hypothetical protein